MFVVADFSEERIQKLQRYIKKHDLDLIEVGCGIPVFNSREVFLTSIRSLVMQREQSLILVSDDNSEDKTILNQFKEEFAHIKNILFFQSPIRIGQLENTKLVRDFFIHFIPTCRYYFLGSDHDLWHFEFTSNLKMAFEEHPDSLMAFPDSLVLNYDLKSHGARWDSILGAVQDLAKNPWILEKNHEKFQEFSKVQGSLMYGETLLRKIAFIKNSLSAGNMIYGMENLEKSRAIPYYEPTLGPDRLFLLKLLGRGSVIQLRKRLWLRVQFSRHERDRQIKNLFVGRAKPSKVFIKFPDLHHGVLLLKEKSLPLLYRVFVAIWLTIKIVHRKCSKTYQLTFKRIINSVKRVKHRGKRAIFVLVKRPLRRILHFYVKRFRMVFHFSIKKFRFLGHAGKKRLRWQVHLVKKFVLRLRGFLNRRLSPFLNRDFEGSETNSNSENKDY